MRRKKNVRRGLIGCFLVLLLAGLAVAGAALGAHIVRTPDGIKVYPKKAWSLTDTWADVSSWKITDLGAHQDLVMTMLERGDGKALPAGGLLVEMQNQGLSVPKALAAIESGVQNTDKLREIAAKGQKKADELKKVAEGVKNGLKDAADKIDGIWKK